MGNKNTINIAEEKYNSRKGDALQGVDENLSEHTVEYRAEEARDYILKNTANSKLLDDILEGKTENRQQVVDLIRDYAEKNGVILPGATELPDVVKVLENAILDFDVLTDLINDPLIDEIRVNSPADIRIVKKGFEYRTTRKFSSKKKAYTVAQSIARIAKKAIKPDTPCLDTRLSNGVRVAIMAEPVCLTGINMTIRKQREEPITVQNLIEWDTLCPDMVEFIKMCCDGDLSMKFYGGTGSGKTGTLGAFVREYPDDKRVLSIADTDEMNLLRLDDDGNAINSVLMWETVEGIFDFADGLRAGLRHTPKTIVPQEARGGEYADAVNAAITDHQVLICLHAKDVQTLQDRCLAMFKASGSDLPAEMILRLISGAFNIVARMKETKDGTKRMVDISEFVGYDPTKQLIMTSSIFKFETMDSYEEAIYDEHLKEDVIRTKIVGQYKRTGSISDKVAEILLENCIPRALVDKYRYPSKERGV